MQGVVSTGTVGGATIIPSAEHLMFNIFFKKGGQKKEKKISISIISSQQSLKGSATATSTGWEIEKAWLSLSSEYVGFFCLPQDSFTYLTLLLLLQLVGFLWYAP